MDDLSRPLQAIAAVGGSPFWVGFFITLLFTLAPGPMNAVIIEQSIEKGVLAGLRIAVGNCLGGMIAVFLASLPFLFGIYWLSLWLGTHVTLATALAAIVLLAVGLHMLLSKTNGRQHNKPGIGYALWAFAYTALHPGNLLTDMALVTALQANGSITGGMDVFLLIVGFMAGCGLGWLVYLAILAKMRSKISARLMKGLKIVLACIIIGFALLMFAGLWTM